MTDDAKLLRRYADLRTEAAFAEFVSRHLGLVYFAALRRTGGNAALAEDVAQAVFTEAARHARTLARHAAVTGWLYTTTRFIAGKTMRTELTRRRLEQKAAQTRALIAEEGAAEWERLRPVIDEALEELDERDRESVLLRFFEGQPFAVIGRAARISEDAARMRVERALARLRAALQRRGVTSTEAALGLVLAQQAASAVPAGLAVTVTGAAVAGAAAAGTMVAGAALVAFMSTTKMAASLALAALVAVGFAVRERRAATRAEAALAEVQHAREMPAQWVRASARRTADAGWLAANAAPAQPAATASAAARSALALEEQGRENGRALMARHPEVKAALERWSAGQVSAAFAPFFQTQGLSAAQIERFKELHRGRHSLGWETSDDSGGMEYLHLELPVVAVGPAFAAEIQELLGPDGFRAYEAYERMGEAREVVQRIGAALAFGEAPLTPEQAAQLVRIVDAGAIEESFSAPPSGAPIEDPRLEGSERSQTEQWTASHRPIFSFNWDLVSERARALLSPAQFAAVARLRVEERHNDAWRQALKEWKP
jgi:RNA polymerase sigma factor (sigma-70 family)